ncbi:MAG: transglycosylase SLT domain-containing protein [Granulosicoccus sp.]|nr:transglycosylase SLT domain-containing protein [Granulosicoccus sp.]
MHVHYNKQSPLPVSAMLRLVALIFFVQGCASTHLHNPENICSIFEQKRGWYKASVRAEKKWGTPLSTPMAIMYQESAFKARARPPRRWYFGFIPGRRASSAYGYAQAIDGTWQAYLRDTGDYGRSRRNFADSLDFIHWYMREAQEKNGIKKHDPYHLYLNYHEGLQGFRRRSFEGKTGLLKAARKVQARSGRYAEQYASCRKSLSRGWFRRWLGF